MYDNFSLNKIKYKQEEKKNNAISYSLRAYESKIKEREKNWLLDQSKNHSEKN